MDNHSKQIAEMIRNGTYFKESRDWYAVKYIGPVSERTFFLIIAGLAGLVALFATFAVMGFLPLTDRKPVIIANDRFFEATPQLVSMRSKNSKTPVNNAIMRFFLTNYVDKRESYGQDVYDANRNFIKAQSDAPTYADYVARYDESNKQSPAAVLAPYGRRKVTLNSVSIDEHADPKVATVKFSTEIVGYTQTMHTEWTAVLQFYYTDLVVTTVTDPKTHQPTVQTQDPQFQVVKYALTQKS